MKFAVRTEFDRAFLALAPGRAFDIAGNPDAADEAALLRRFDARAETGIIGPGEAGAHRALEIADVIGARGLREIGHLRRFDEIARADFLGRDV